MAQFLLSVHAVAGNPPPSMAVIEQMYADVGSFNTDLMAAGSFVFGGGLQPANESTLVDATGDQPTVRDGVRTTGPETLGGFWVIDVADPDTAQKWAIRASRACAGPIEVRPFQPEA